MKKAQQRIDKILEAVRTRIQDEVSGLIGATFILSDLQRQFVSKEEAFEQLPGKQVMAKMDITGDIQGQGCLLLDVKDAIRLGGTLIMLPESSLDEVVTAGNMTKKRKIRMAKSPTSSPDRIQKFLRRPIRIIVGSSEKRRK